MLKLNRTYLIIILFIHFYDITSGYELGCGDWDAYSDQKCLKLFDQLVIETDAENQCKENNSTLLTITSWSEQEFLNNLLFNKYHIVDNIWLGIKMNNTSAVWVETSNTEAAIRFTNWATGTPTNASDKTCAQLVSDGIQKGNWFDVSCKKSNKFVCQTPQISYNSSQQTFLLSAIEYLSQSLETVKQQLTEQQSVINTLKQSTIPVGFVYVQLPYERPPSELWPTVKWTDVSAQYAGVFFRVNGGNAAQFGQIQNESAPHLQSVFYGSYLTAFTNAENDANFQSLAIPANGNSSNVQGYGIRDLKFSMSGGEVRPKNMAIRIWKRD